MAGSPGDGLEAKRRREFRRMVVVSTLAHAGALGLAVSSPAPLAVAPPQVISVELVSDPSRPAAPAKPAAKPAKPSPPKPVAPKPKQTVLPAKPSEPRPTPAKPKPERRKEVFLEPAPKQEKSLEDLLAEMREDQGEPTPAPAPAATPEPKQIASASPGGPSGIGRPVPPEVLDWMRRAKLHVRRAWVVPPGFRMQDLQTHVVVTLDGAGNVVGTPEIARRSGNPYYDEGVVRGIEKASPLPAPPEAGDWDFIFMPEDSF